MLFSVTLRPARLGRRLLPATKSQGHTVLQACPEFLGEWLGARFAAPGFTTSDQKASGSIGRKVRDDKV